jgi:predicted PurR-regulated permease PerM
VAAVGMAFSSRIIEESGELKQEAVQITKTAKSQINSLPDWIRPTANDTLYSFEKVTALSAPTLLSIVPKAFSRILSFIIFIFAAFYFLKEGRKMFDKFLKFVPNDFKVETEILMRKINSVLGSYLRGQVFLIFFISLLLFICLTILGFKFALILAVFSGFAEIVPIIGPIVAATVAAIVVFIIGVANFGLNPLQAAIAVIIIYTVVRQVQDYLINPYVMGKITKLHPLIILFAVIAGEHTAGILGLILAVPIAGVLKIIFEYSLDKINESSLH